MANLSQMAADGLDQHDFMAIFDTDIYGRFDGMSIPLEAEPPVATGNIISVSAFPSVRQLPDNVASSAPGVPEQDSQPANSDEQTLAPAAPEQDAAAAATRSPSQPRTLAAVVVPSSTSATSPPAQAQNNANSTLTEFTKRKGWQAKVVEEIRDLVQIVDSEGRIKYSSTSLTALTGWSPQEIESRMLKDMIHPDDVGVFVSEMSEAAASGNPLRMFYRFKKKADGYAILEVVGHAHIASAKFSTNLDDINQSAFCQAVFLMCREYPTKNSALLDSFLEHKMENERLKKRISDLRHEEDMADDDSHKLWLHNQESISDIQSDITLGTSPTRNAAALPLNPATASVNGMTGPIPNQVLHGSVDASALNMALTREALEATAVNRPDSLRDKMARYENAASHAETIERLTGMRYIEPGDRARGLAGVGGGTAAPLKGDAGIAIPVDRDPRTGEKKKKLKASEEYVCTDCGVLDSPEWRKGPSGPKTLCNACGLRWAKREKKSRSGSNNAGAGRNNAPTED